jgi:hypothetical protein
MSVFTPDPATLTQRLLDTPTPTPLSESIAADIGVQILVRALGVMRLHVSGFALNWAKVELVRCERKARQAADREFSSIPKAGLDEVYARTRAVLADRVALLGAYGSGLG